MKTFKDYLVEAYRTDRDAGDKYDDWMALSPKERNQIRNRKWNGDPQDEPDWEEEEDEEAPEDCPVCNEEDSVEYGYSFCDKCSDKVLAIEEKEKSNKKLSKDEQDFIDNYRKVGKEKNWRMD